MNAQPIYNLHPAEVRPIDEMRLRREGAFIVEFEKGTPTNITPIRCDVEMKLTEPEVSG